MVGRVRIAVLALLAATAGCPSSPLSDARALESGGDKEGAAEAYFTVAKDDAANLAAWDSAVRIWCDELARIDKCLDVLDAELATLGNLQRHQDALSKALELRARTRMKAGLVKSALMDLERAKKAGPGRASVFVAKARGYAMLGVRHLAEQALEQARKLDPNNEEANEVAKMLPAEEGFGGQ